MLRVLGSRKRLCDGSTRRDFLAAGGLVPFGLSLADTLRASEPVPGPTGDRTFGKAKACILLFLYGSPSQIEFADQKPDAPVEVRGELGSIKSTLPGCDVCELLPHTSRVMHNVTVVRSMTHPHPIHGVAYATSSVVDIDVGMELRPHDPGHWPFMGSAVAYLERRNNPRAAQKPVPDNVALPWPFSSRRTGEVSRAGPYAAFLGGAYHPHYATFQGTANRQITKTLNEAVREFDEPYVGTAADSYFALGGEPPAELTLDRLDARRSLLDQFDAARRQRDKAAADPFREQAYALLGSEKLRQALDVRRESPKVRES